MLRGCFVALLLHPLLTGNSVTAQPTSTLTVGTGTTDGYYSPIYSCFGYNYVQQIYTQAEIIAANGGNPTPTNTITKIRFHISTGSYNSSTTSFTDWTVWMGSTPTSSFSSNTSWIPLTSMTQVYTGNVTFPANGNWLEITLPTPFIWDGTSNIVVAVDENTPGYSCTMQWTSTNMTDNKVIYYYDDNNNPDPNSPPSANGTTSTRANIQFEFLVPPDNAGVDSIFVPEMPFCSGVQTVMARIHNYGSNMVDNVNVNWSVGGVAQSAIAYSTPIDMENTPAGPYAIVALGPVDFPYNSPKEIKAWTSMPNGNADTKPENDTTTTTITGELQGINNFSMTPTNDTAICIGSSITFDAGTHPKNPIYIWSNGVLTQTNTVTEAGIVTVKVQNTDGCTAYDTATVTTLPNPVANSIAIIDNGGGSFTFNIIGAQYIDNYVWDFGDSSPTESGPGPKTHLYTQQGEYNATVTLSNECDEIVITRLIAVGSLLGIDDLNELQKDLKVFPNPGKETVTIASNNSSIKMTNVEVYNLMGQKVYSSEIKSEKHKLDVSAFSAGIYNVLINTNKGKVTKKLEVIK